MTGSVGKLEIQLQSTLIRLIEMYDLQKLLAFKGIQNDIKKLISAILPHINITYQEVQVEENQETVEVGSQGEALGFPQEGDSNEVEKTFLQSQSVKKTEEEICTSQLSNVNYKSSEVVSVHNYFKFLYALSTTNQNCFFQLFFPPAVHYVTDVVEVIFLN